MEFFHIMIHEKIFKGIKTEVAFRYYSKYAPERKYTRPQAQKQFIQDRNVDVALIEKVIDEIYKEQKKALK